MRCNYSPMSEINKIPPEGMKVGQVLPTVFDLIRNTFSMILSPVTGNWGYIVC